MFELFLPPTTIITSARAASSVASRWRSLVVWQMVLWTVTPSYRARIAAHTASYRSGGSVVCATTVTGPLSVSACASAGVLTATPRPRAQPNMPCTSGWRESPTTTTV